MAPKPAERGEGPERHPAAVLVAHRRRRATALDAVRPAPTGQPRAQAGPDHERTRGGRLGGPHDPVEEPPLGAPIGPDLGAAQCHYI